MIRLTSDKTVHKVYALLEKTNFLRMLQHTNLCGNTRICIVYHVQLSFMIFG